jgi:hypothetical protein
MEVEGSVDIYEQASAVNNSASGATRKMDDGIQLSRVSGKNGPKDKIFELKNTQTLPGFGSQ